MVPSLKQDRKFVHAIEAKNRCTMLRGTKDYPTAKELSDITVKVFSSIILETSGKIQRQTATIHCQGSENATISLVFFTSASACLTN